LAKGFLGQHTQVDVSVVHKCVRWSARLIIVMRMTALHPQVHHYLGGAYIALKDVYLPAQPAGDIAPNGKTRGKGDASAAHTLQRMQSRHQVACLFVWPLLHSAERQSSCACALQAWRGIPSAQASWRGCGATLRACSVWWTRWVVSLPWCRLMTLQSTMRRGASCSRHS